MFLPFTTQPELNIQLHPTVKELGCSILAYAGKAESQNCIVNSINDILLVFAKKKMLILEKYTTYVEDNKNHQKFTPTDNGKHFYILLSSLFIF